MTVIAWDGKILAADRRGSNAGFGYEITKIHRVPGGVVAFSGGGAHAFELLEWFKGGRDPKTYPKGNADDGAGSLFISSDGKIHQYAYNGAYPEIIESPIFARGAGRDYALAAMHCGKNAREAVEVACVFETSCGHGVDSLTLEP